MATKGPSNRYGNARHGAQGQGNNKIGFAWAKGFTASGLKRHVAEHMESMGFKTAQEYQSHAVVFANTIDKKNCRSYVRKDGSTVKYNTKTEEFVVVNKTGVIVTYFHPKNGLSYYKNDKKLNSVKSDRSKK